MRQIRPQPYTSNIWSRPRAAFLCRSLSSVSMWCKSTLHVDVGRCRYIVGLSTGGTSYQPKRDRLPHAVET